MNPHECAQQVIDREDEWRIDIESIDIEKLQSIIAEVIQASIDNLSKPISESFGTVTVQSPRQNPRLTSIEQRTLDAIRHLDNAFTGFSPEDLPYTINRPKYVCNGLVHKGYLRHEVRGPIDNLVRVYFLIT